MQLPYSKDLKPVILSAMEILNSCLVAFLGTLFCIYLLKPVAFRIGLVARPGGHKWHQNDVPLIGGIAMFFGFCFALLLFHESLHSYRGLLAGSGLLVFMGVVDDFHELNPKLRLMGQVIAALFMVTWGQQLVLSLGHIFFTGPFHLGYWALPVTLLAVVAYINAFNMIDGQDGLAGGVAFGQAILLLFLSFHAEKYSEVYLLTILCTLLLVFLGFNMRTFWRKSASIFMGDAGSTFLAFLIAWFAVDLSQTKSSLIYPITILWILALPLFDLINVCLHRIYKGKSPLKAGRDHLHHVLHAKGINTTLSTWLLTTLSFSLGILGILFNYLRISEGVQFVTFMGLLVLYLFLVIPLRDGE